MQILVLYGTSEGQTRKIAAFVTQRLARHGHRVVMVNAAEADSVPDPHRFDAIVIAASLHLGRYQREVIRYVREHRASISAHVNVFLSVSLAAAGHEPQDVAGLRKCVADFVRASGWTPQQVHHAAGAFRYTAYGFLTRCVMKYKAHRRGAPTDTRYDHELTDWDDLAHFADTFARAEAIGHA
jgi:menaquinone-dependent protoporphyrinogen oxidase